MLFVVPVVLFDMLKAKQLACVSESGQKCPAARSLSLRRAWIEMSKAGSRESTMSRRSPYGERGLKYRLEHPRGRVGQSLSLRRAWIEIRCNAALELATFGRSPYGERGLKFQIPARCVVIPGRSPYGERGLKFSFTSAWSIGCRRSPYGERGLKSRRVPRPRCYCLVALLTESVD